MAERRWTVSCCNEHPANRVRFISGSLACHACEEARNEIGFPAPEELGIEKKAPAFHNVEVMPVADHLTALQQQRKQVITEVKEALTKLDRYEPERVEPYGYEAPYGRFLDRDDVLEALTTLKGGTDAS